MTRSYCILATLIGLMVAGIFQSAQAQVPARIAYQGLFLNEAGGATLPDGAYTVTFRLYDEERQGTLVWEERRTLDVNKGLFSLFLGEQTALDLPFDEPYWLSIEVDGQTESARMPLAAAPYSLAARSLSDSALVAGPGIEIRRAGQQLEVALAPELYDQLLNALTSGTPVNLSGLTDTGGDNTGLDIASPGIGSDTGLDDAYDDGRIVTADEGPVIFKTLPATGASIPFVLQSLSTGPIIVGYGGNGGGYEFQIANDGTIRLNSVAGVTSVFFRANGLGDAGEFELYDTGVTGAMLELQGDGAGSGAEILMSRNNGGSASKTIELEADGANSAGVMRLFRTGSATSTIEMLASEAGGQGASIHLRDAVGNTTIEMDGDFDGDGRVITEELQITGGSDLSENFDITSNFGVAAPAPGMVVSIDPANPGQLTVSGTPYDRMVAGVVSGAGGIETGLIMAQLGSEADGQFPVALTGRVYVYVDASYGAVTPGDLLTSSATPGHAMKATDYARSQGAILGKAMTGLSEGSGLVLVLVSLQ